jgi:hypothetical protein
VPDFEAHGLAAFVARGVAHLSRSSQ